MSSVPVYSSAIAPRAWSGTRNFNEFRTAIDRRVLRVFENKSLKRVLREHAKVNLETLWDRTVKALQHVEPPLEGQSYEQSDIHRSIVEGLPGEALYIASAMAFGSMQEALPFFDVSAKTARLRMGALLSSSQGELALRLGRVLTIAGGVFESFDHGRDFLRTPNFALGGTMPRDLLKTAQGEQIVLEELQMQAAGGPP